MQRVVTLQGSITEVLQCLQWGGKKITLQIKKILRNKVVKPERHRIVKCMRYWGIKVSPKTSKRRHESPISGYIASSLGCVRDGTRKQGKLTCGKQVTKQRGHQGRKEGRNSLASPTLPRLCILVQHIPLLYIYFFLPNFHHWYRSLTGWQKWHENLYNEVTQH